MATLQTPDFWRVNSYAYPNYFRKRIWILAYPISSELREQSGWSSGESGENALLSTNNGKERSMAHASVPNTKSEQMGATGQSREYRCMGDLPEPSGTVGRGSTWTGRQQWIQSQIEESRWQNRGETNGIWVAEPGVDRVAFGVPRRVDRIKGLGNSVVPQVVKVLGEAIQYSEEMAL